MGLDIDMKFHQEVMEIVSYDINKLVPVIRSSAYHIFDNSCTGNLDFSKKSLAIAPKIK